MKQKYCYVCGARYVFMVSGVGDATVVFYFIILQHIGQVNTVRYELYETC